MSAHSSKPQKEDHLSDLVIRRVKLETVIPVRMRELDPPRSWDDAVSAGDKAPGSIHFGAYLKDDLVGVSSVGPESSPLLPDMPALRFRGLAVINAYRGHGIGTQLFLAQRDFSDSHGIRIAWFFAKARLTRLYTRLGFTQTPYVHVHHNAGPVLLFMNAHAMDVYTTQSRQPSSSGQS